MENKQSYAEILLEMIRESRLSLKEISERCSEQGVGVTPSYLSKLQRAHQPAASDRVNEAIAYACDADKKTSDLLRFKAVYEKLPPYLQITRSGIPEPISSMGLKEKMLEPDPDQRLNILVEYLRDAEDMCERIEAQAAELNLNLSEARTLMNAWAISITKEVLCVVNQNKRAGVHQ